MFETILSTFIPQMAQPLYSVLGHICVWFEQLAV